MSPATNDRAWSLIEPYWSPLNESWDGGAAKFLEHIGRIPVRVGLLYSGNWCVSEVDNGGFLQFFWNSTGILAPEAAACLKDMGATELARIVARAMRYFGPKYPRDREARLMVLGGVGLEYPRRSPFEGEDEAFYGWFERERQPWSALMERYAQGA